MKRILMYRIIVLIVAISMFSCNFSTGDASSKKDNQNTNYENKKDCNDVHWSHHGSVDGPENWKNLCDGFSSCGGRVQSPININTSEISVDTALSQFEIRYSSSKVDIINNGHTVQFNIIGNNTLLIGDKEYELLQFHYHAHSEHTVDGKYFPLEVHLVHKYSDTDYAVLGIMFEEGETNDLFTNYLAQFPVDEGKYVSDEMIELNALFPADLSYYFYKGSLTTPPCSEVVNWYILKSPLMASKDQIDKFSEILHNNFRPIMPLNNREVFSSQE